MLHFLSASFLTLICFAVRPAVAQVGLGLHAGVNVASISRNPDALSVSPLAAKAGFVFSGILDVRLTDLLYFQPGLSYTQKGYTQTFSDITVTFALDYLEIPVLLKTKFGKDELKPYLFAGPNIGFNLSAQGSAPNVAASDIKEFVEPLDVALEFGGGIEVVVAPKVNLLFDVRYALGLSDIDKSSNASINTRGIKLLAGVLFDL